MTRGDVLRKGSCFPGWVPRCSPSCLPFAESDGAGATGPDSALVPRGKLLAVNLYHTCHSILTARVMHLARILPSKALGTLQEENKIMRHCLLQTEPGFCFCCPSLVGLGVMHVPGFMAGLNPKPPGICSWLEGNVLLQEVERALGR